MEKRPAQEEKIIDSRTLKTLLEWQAPTRPFKKRSREYFSTVGAIALLLIIILLFLKEWLLVAVIIALAFVVYIMGTVPPEQASHKITTLGVTTGDKSYDWEQLSRFWFEQKWEQKILYLETRLRFPRVLMMLLGETDQKKVEAILSDYLLLQQPEKTWIDKASHWLTNKVPLEETK